MSQKVTKAFSRQIIKTKDKQSKHNAKTSKQIYDFPEEQTPTTFSKFDNKPRAKRQLKLKSARKSDRSSTFKNKMCLPAAPKTPKPLKEKQISNRSRSRKVASSSNVLQQQDRCESMYSPIENHEFLSDSDETVATAAITSNIQRFLALMQKSPTFHSHSQGSSRSERSKKRARSNIGIDSDVEKKVDNDYDKELINLIKEMQKQNVSVATLAQTIPGVSEEELQRWIDFDISAFAPAQRQELEKHLEQAWHTSHLRSPSANVSKLAKINPIVNLKKLAISPEAIRKINQIPDTTNKRAPVATKLKTPVKSVRTQTKFVDPRSRDLQLQPATFEHTASTSANEIVNAIVTQPAIATFLSQFQQLMQFALTKSLVPGAGESPVEPEVVAVAKDQMNIDIDIGIDQYAPHIDENEARTPHKKRKRIKANVDNGNGAGDKAMLDADNDGHQHVLLSDSSQESDLMSPPPRNKKEASLKSQTKKQSQHDSSTNGNDDEAGENVIDSGTDDPWQFPVSRDKILSSIKANRIVISLNDRRRERIRAYKKLQYS